MAKARMALGVVTGCLLSWSASALAATPPTVAQMLTLRPKLDGVNYSTPTAQELSACKVELVNGGRAGSSGWILRDPQGRPLRRFFDLNGDKKVDMWSYYQDGVEVYREIDSNFNEKVDQYRWFNTGGMKWGVDNNEDGKIDSWKYISAEEVSQELLQAYLTKDLARLQALLITDAELRSLELPSAEASRIYQLQSTAAAKFQATVGKLKLSDKTQWVRFDAGLVQCVPADAIGSKQDLIKHGRGTVLYEVNGKHEFLPTGEMLLVGHAWRLLEVPGDVTDEPKESQSPKLKDALEALRNLDKNPPNTPAEIGGYNLKRADIILAIMAEDKPEQRDSWLKQLIECYSAAAQAAEGDAAAYDKLLKLSAQTAKGQPGSALASFAVFREMQAWYANELSKVKNPNDFPKVQNQWLERLTQFVQAYPHTDETPEALMQLGMVNEFVGKEVEAKNWYGKLVKEFPNHPLAAKAGGAIQRLELEGKPFTLNAKSFDAGKIAGKVTVIYYWASWNQSCVGDFAQMKMIMSKFSKGLEMVFVNVDDGPPEADGQKIAPPGGIQLSAPGGLNSPVAVQYGIHSLPTMFLVGADGKVLTTKVNVATLEDEVKKVLK
jgi:tetratricopeptide (TPR) repeat protein